MAALQHNTTATKTATTIAHFSIFFILCPSRSDKHIAANLFLHSSRSR